MLAAASACRKFHVFLYGKPFTIFTDHKRHHVHNATENVGANARPGIQGGIISNYTSGHPLPRGDDTKRELGLTKHVRHYTNFVIENSFPKAINKEETVGDNGEGRRVTKTNRLSREACCSWRTRPARGTYRCATGTSRKNGKVCPRRPSRNFAYKAVAPCSRVVPWNWCNGRNVEECLSCQATTVCNTSGPLLMTELPSGPWRKVSVDFVGPFLNKDMALVFWDQYVWYPVVEFTTSTSADSFIPLFTRVFNMFGILKRLSRTMGSRLMDRNFQTLLRNRDSDIERSLLPGLRPMETENVFCRCWKRAPKSPDLKGNSFDTKFKKPLATIVLCPTKWQSKPRTRLRLEESYVGNYPKG